MPINKLTPDIPYQVDYNAILMHKPMVKDCFEDLSNRLYLSDNNTPNTIDIKDSNWYGMSGVNLLFGIIYLPLSFFNSSMQSFISLLNSSANVFILYSLNALVLYFTSKQFT